MTSALAQSPNGREARHAHLDAAIGRRDRAAGISEQVGGCGRVLLTAGVHVCVIARTRAGADIEAHFVVRARHGNLCHVVGARITPGARKRRHQRQLERRRIGPGRNRIAVRHQPTGEIATVGVKRMQVERALGDIRGQERFSGLFAAARELPQQSQHAIQAITLRVQRRQRRCGAPWSGLQQRHRRQQGRQTIAERMCHAAKQIVMYRQPSRRAIRMAVVTAHR